MKAGALDDGPCPRCGVYMEPGERGFAATNELRGGHDTDEQGACETCWDYVGEHGKWPER